MIRVGTQPISQGFWSFSTIDSLKKYVLQKLGTSDRLDYWDSTENTSSTLYR